MRSIEASRASLEAYSLGEGPFWIPQSAEVGWVDISAGTVYRGVLNKGRIRTTHAHSLGSTVGCAVPTSEGGLLVACSNYLAVIDAERGIRRGPELPARADAARFNDGACDPAGRFFVGTMSLEGKRGREALYRLEPDGGLEPVLDGLTLSNGVAWAPDASWLYLVDSVPGVIWKIAYDLGSGELGREQLLVVFDGSTPDGLCVDVEGNLWVAFWGAGEVRCLSPDGEPLASVAVPAPNCSSVAFVGPELDRLLITSARQDLTPRELAEHPDSGRLFVADPQAKGVAGAAFAGNHSAWSWLTQRHPMNDA